MSSVQALVGAINTWPVWSEAVCLSCIWSVAALLLAAKWNCPNDTFFAITKAELRAKQIVIFCLRSCAGIHQLDVLLDTIEVVRMDIYCA